MRTTGSTGSTDAAGAPTIADVRAAAARIAGYVHRTPVVTCTAIDEIAGASLFFKCENLQRAGAFKMRGASNAVLSLDDEAAARGVVTHSSGNHAGALARAARTRGIPAYVVMPHTAPVVKRRAVESYGAEITFCEPVTEERERVCADVAARTGATLIPPFDDARVIAGQGTVALELHAQVPDLDAVVAPVGGGGLLSGIAIATAAAAPAVEVFGAEPAAADTATRALAAGAPVAAGNPTTVADGLRTSLGRLTQPIIAAGVRGIVRVEEQQIVAAMRLLWERAKLVVEPSGAVPLAAVLAAPARFAGRRVGIVLSGGNVDLDRLPW